MATKEALARSLFLRIEHYPIEDWVADRRDDGESWRSIRQELRSIDPALDFPIQTLINWFEHASTPEVAA